MLAWREETGLMGMKTHNAGGQESELETVFSQQEWSDICDRLELSPRQQEIAFLLTKGMGDKQIAAQMKLSIPTVRTHLTRLFGRLGVNDRVDTVVHIFRIFRSMKGEA